MSNTQTPEDIRQNMNRMLTKMHEIGGSDLFISVDFPPSIKYQGSMKPMSQQRLN